jgi:hypothetical protein
MTLETRTAEAAAPIGHNSGLSDSYELIDRTLRRTDEIEKGASEYLAAENPDLMRRLREIEASIAAGLPGRIDSQADAEKLSDLRNALKKWIAAAKLARTGAKKPWDGIAKAFFAFFTRPIERLEKIDDESIGPVLTDWQEREAGSKRREEEERARILREEADRKMREAAEAESRRLEAEQREREAKEAAERAERDRLAAIKAADDAKRAREEEERRAVEAKAKAKAEEVARREREAREAAERKERERLEAIEAEARAAAKAERERIEAEEAAARKAAREAEEAAAEVRRAELRRQELEAKEAARKAQEERREAERQAIAARKEIRAETRNESEAVEAAERADKNADKSETKSHAKPADLSRVRGEHGSVSSLRTFLNFRDLDRAELDLEALRYHLPLAALETAVRSYINVGGTKLRGVEIFEDQSTVTR